jgi:AraC-like DNA-binding protein
MNAKDTIYIKHMVCPRCIRAVEKIFSEADIEVVQVLLGQVLLNADLSADKYEQVREELIKEGFELIEDKSEQLLTQIRSLVIKWVHYPDSRRQHSTLSEMLVSKLPHTYSYLSRLFSKHEGMTLERFYMNQRILRAKELLSYDEFSLKEIADQLNFSSPSHLSAQFKHYTGMTASEYRTIKPQRPGIDEI